MLHLLATPAVPYPADPFVEEYAPPQSREVGTAAGQVRVTAAGGLALAPKLQPIGQVGLEQMTFPYLGLRSAVVFAVTDGDEAPRFLAATTGPSLHILPYRVVDISLFVGGGLGWLPTIRSWAPVLRPGIAFDVSISSWLAVHVEGTTSWGRFVSDGSPRNYTQAAGLLGLCLAI